MKYPTIPVIDNTSIKNINSRAEEFKNKYKEFKVNYVKLNDMSQIWNNSKELDVAISRVKDSNGTGDCQALFRAFGDRLPYVDRHEAVKEFIGYSRPLGDGTVFSGFPMWGR